MKRLSYLLLASIFVFLLEFLHTARLGAVDSWNMGVYDPLPYGVWHAYTEGIYDLQNNRWELFYPNSQRLQRIEYLGSDASCTLLQYERNLKHTQEGSQGWGHYNDDYILKRPDGTRQENYWWWSNPITPPPVWAAWGESWSSWFSHGMGVPQRGLWTWFPAVLESGKYWTGYEYHTLNGSSWSPPMDGDDFLWAGYTSPCGGPWTDPYTSYGSWKVTYIYAYPDYYTVNTFDGTFYNVLAVWEAQYQWNASEIRWDTISKTWRYYAPNVGLIQLINYEPPNNGWLFGFCRDC